VNELDSNKNQKQHQASKAKTFFHRDRHAKIKMVTAFLTKAARLESAACAASIGSRARAYPSMMPVNRIPSGGDRKGGRGLPLCFGGPAG
jgi:hypothetical protein